MQYKEFLESKIVVAEKYGFDIRNKSMDPILKPHQSDIVKWSLNGGRRAIFASFGLGKTIMQLEIAIQVIRKTKKPFLVCLPLGVIGEFKDDLTLLSTDIELEYITDTDSVTNWEKKIYLTNYERIRKGDIDASVFGGVSFDEASCLRSLGSQTTNYVLDHFTKVPYRFVATATPTPNDYIEILNYADYLGVIDRGHALTRFFQRDSTKAGNLKLYENKKQEFWMWVSTWAIFINKPSDLGYDDKGYDLPKMHVHDIEVKNIQDESYVDDRGQVTLYTKNKTSLTATSKEKSSSLKIRVQKAKELVDADPDNHWILWHHREKEREEITKVFKDYDLRSVYGSQKNDLKEKNLNDFKNGRFKILSTKPSIAGSGCNFQKHCHNVIYVGIDYKFNNFIQALHRTYRFNQNHEVNVYIIFTNNEYDVLKKLKMKWKNHINLQTEMINIVREYGLNNDKISADMKRKIFNNPRSSEVLGCTLFNNDTTITHKEMDSDSTDMILTSIPFGDHYEYSDNYNDFGHNDGNDNFFKQMDYLTPELLRTLKPGRIAAIHVKDRIRYSYQNGTSFTTIKDFSGQTVQHFEKHGFYLIGKITITTDVVRENNQTYRLGWSEQCKDGSKMGVGLPEYVLLFRKPPTESNNAYSDEPVSKTKEEYTRANWQLDAHAYWRSNGNRFLASNDLDKRSMKVIFNQWKEFNENEVYSFIEHLESCEELEAREKLSSLFMTLPTISNNELVWTDVNRMKTLNANQANRKKEKHICPLQFDIIDRLINRYSMEGDIIDDPFGGLFSTAYRAVQMNRKCISTELNPDYYDDGLFYMKSLEYKLSVPTLFDIAS